MDALGPLLHVLHRAKKGKCTAKDLVPPLETAIKLTGNAAAHLSVELRRALMKHLNSDLKSLADGDFSDRGLLLQKQNPQLTMSTLLRASYTKKNSKGFSGSGDQNKRKSFQPQGRHTYWGTQRHTQGQRFSVFNRLAPPLRQNPRFRSRPSTPRSRPCPARLTRYLYSTYEARMDPVCVPPIIPGGWFPLAGQPESRILLYHIPGSQERVRASSEFEASKPVSAKGTFQNGGCACGARSPAKGRLDVQDRLEGCIFCNTYLQRAPVSVAFHLGLGDVSVYMPSVWPSISASSFHQGPATSSGVSTPRRSEVCDLPGRSPHHGRQQGPSSLAVCCSNSVTRMSRLSRELLQISDTANTGTNLLGPQHRLQERGTESALSEAVPDTETGQEIAGSDFRFSQRDSTVCREAVGNSSGDPPSSPPLPGPSTPEAPGTARQSELQQPHPHISSGQGRTRVVASGGLSMEWEESSDRSSRVGDRDGCLPDWVGSILSGQPHRWPVVRGGTEPTHQRAGAVGSSVCFSEACQRYQCPAEERQCHHCRIHQSPRRHKVAGTSQSLEGAVALVSPKRHNTQSTTPTRQGESQCVSPLERQNRLDSQSSSVQHHQSGVGSTASGSFCNQILSAVAKLLQLASRSGSRGNRCFLSRLEEFTGLCSSSMVPHRSSFSEGSLPESDVGSGNSMLADTAMVSPADGDAHRFSPSSSGSTPVPSGHAFSQLRLPSSNDPSSVGRMEGLRGHLRAEAISEGAINLILASWREKTNATYNSAWRKWERWCTTHNTDPFSANIANVLEFLTEEFKAGRGYRSLNCYRSAISSTHLPIQGFAVGKHPLVCRLLKGTFNLRPPQPKYFCFWEVGKVLSFLHQSGDNANLLEYRLASVAVNMPTKIRKN